MHHATTDERVFFPFDIERQFGRILRTVEWTVERMLAPDEEREDVVHDVLLRVVARARQPRPPEPLDVWVQRTAREMVWKTLRRSGRNLPLDPLPEDALPYYSFDVEGRELAVRVASTVARLPASNRALLLERWFTSATTDELSRRAGCSDSTIKRRLKRAYRRFKKLALADKKIAESLALRTNRRARATASGRREPVWENETINRPR